MHKLWSYTALFSDWKVQIAACPSCHRTFEEWVFVQTASVLFDQKAGELLTLPAVQFDLPITRRLACLECLSAKWGMSCQVLQQDDGSSKVIVYNAPLVQARLNEVPPYILCGALGYARTITPDAFVLEVARRWQEQGTIPHEIGLALGYPAKDVLGYMGLLQLEFTACCGWRVYGDPTHSLTMSQACQDATQCALRFLYQQVASSEDAAAV